MTKKTKDHPKLRYQAAYFRFATTVWGRLNTTPDAHGNSNNLDNLLRNSAGRCAILNYAKAVIIDLHRGGKVMYVLKRNQGSITITSH